MKKNRERDPITAKISWVFIGIAVGIGVSLTVLSFSLQIPVKDGWDVANWATLVVEIGIGLAIASAILIYEGGKREKSQEQQDRITEILEEVKKIEDYQQKYLQKEEHDKIQKKFAAQDAMHIPCVLAYSSMYDLRKLLLTPESERLSDHDKRIADERKQVDTWLKEIQNVTNQYSSSLTDQAILSLNGIVSFYNDETLTKHFGGIKEMIDKGLTSMDLKPLEPIEG
ncbi:hypothetical protein [Nitrosopumilus adriaticus]|uniref:Uncharacterized protein n=1 Tax=Nitrosopumilus adriaticus TaxID=1580092 RepID=A0A0D5C3B7_9ARCH|nr:hypothetical protein [Nitrosopumilus adriaticus]AJW71053.1 hypothetical protein NADRNF5_1367 [Nitrosopumilus adriaticus]